MVVPPHPQLFPTPSPSVGPYPVTVHPPLSNSGPPLKNPRSDLYPHSSSHHRSVHPPPPHPLLTHPSPSSAAAPHPPPPPPAPPPAAHLSSSDPPATTSIPGTHLPLVHQQALLASSTSSSSHQTPPLPHPHQVIVSNPDSFPPLPLAHKSSIPSTIPLPTPSSSNPRPLIVPSSGHQPSAPPPPQRSYAQVTSFVRGPSFVRAHASAVESFARLPRTGANIICGSKEGIPSFSFVNSDLPKVEALYSQALVMKFHGGRPSLEASHKEILSWGMEAPFSIGPLTSRAFLLRFQHNSDLLKVLSRPSSILITFPYKVFRWHNLCHLNEDSCVVPVWISLPKLPLQCFIPEFLEAVANKIGRFLCLDKATSTLARPSAARLCVELDLRKPPPQFIWIGLFEGFKQPIIYDRMPKFCSSCQVLGHLATVCPLGQRETLPPHSGARLLTSRGRTPTNRRYAAENSQSILRQHSSSSVATSSIPTPASASHIMASSSSPPLLEEHQQPPNTEPSPSLTNTISHHPPTPPPPLPNATHPPPAQPQTPHKSFSALPPPHYIDHHKRKSVTFDPLPVQPQPSLEANAAFWDAVNRQVAFEQARLKSVAAHPPPPQATLIPPTTATPPPNEALFQVLQPAGVMQRVPVAVAPPTYSPSSSISQGQAPAPSPTTIPITNPPPATTSDYAVISATAANQTQIQNMLISNQTSQPPLSSNATPSGLTAPSSAQYLPKSPSEISRPDSGLCSPGVCQNAAVLNSPPAAVSGQDNVIVTDLDASEACRTDSLNQPPLQSNLPLLAMTIAEGTPSVCHNADLPNSVNNANLVEDQQLDPINENPNSTAKPINLKQLDVDQGPSLTQQQQDALERFQQKVRAQTQSQGQLLIGSTSANAFEALREDQSDEDDDEYIAASYNSDTDDGPVEPIDMGYQSADGRSSHNLIKSSASVMKTNKRHPNIPLNVRLRARKNSHPSSRKNLYM